MSNVLAEYMKKRVQNSLEQLNKSKTKTGPVVTISRECGCPAKHLAGLLVNRLNIIESSNRSHHTWRWIGKEILEDSAHELHLNPNFVKEMVNKEDVNMVNDMIASLSHKPYPSDTKVKKTVSEIIRGFAESGHFIIVGRGGVSITRDMPNSLHIRLQAPLEWRINNVSSREMISLSEAKKKIAQIDAQRNQLHHYFVGKDPDNTLFDVVFNYSTLSDDEIIGAIVNMMELKDMI